MIYTKKGWLIAMMAAMVACSTQTETLTILHTNDTHSQVECKSDGTGGYAERMSIIAQEKEKDPNLLLVDAGDFCQGTPYFNLYHGRIEVDALNRMGYDVVTLGNHEFDNGIDTLATILKAAQFEVVCANYDVSGTALENIVKPYTIVYKGNLKIGVFGLGIYPDDMIAKKNFEGIQYQPPYPIAQRIADELKAKGCDVVVCLSHMGTYPNKPTDYCDTELAATSKNIDVIIGGHTHKKYDDLYIRNADGKEIPVCQMGKSGIYMGKITLHFATK